MIELKHPYDQYEAGICSGYIASKIEFMVLSDQLCQRDKLNLNDVVESFIQHIEAMQNAHEISATYSVVEILQKQYGCQ